jgi:hypothetical protein
MTDEEFTTIVDLIRTEVQRQDKKWGANRLLDHRTWVTVLAEEVGEVARSGLAAHSRHCKAAHVQILYPDEVK